MRIGGLASGLDTQNLVQELMRAERMPLDRMVQDRTWIEWQRDAYRDLNLQLTNFRESFRATGLGLQSTFLQKSVTSSNEAVVTATGSASALNGSVQIKVEDLATASTFVSSGVTSDVYQASLKDLAEFQNSDFFDDDGNGQLKFQVKRPGDEQAQTVTIDINENESVQDIIHKMGRSGAGFHTFIDENAADEITGQQVVLTMNDTGAGAEISFDTGQELAQNFFRKIGFAGLENEGPNVLQMTNPGQNARVIINGHETERTTNNFTINGITYNLNGVSGDQSVMITAKTDTDKIYDDIMKFVEDYNELIDKINGALREDRHRDFPPLTDEQRKEMSDKEIELWEEKAKSGLLRNDSTLSSALSQMRMALYSQVSKEASSVIQDLSQIGLVSSRDYMDGGKIVLDTESRTIDGKSMDGEERLRYYIENHGEELHQLFMADGEEYGEQGILRRIRGTLDTTIEAVTQRAGREGRTNQQFTLGRQMNSIEDRISNFERRLQQKEDAYWRQFTSLERVMAQLNSQADQMFAMLNPQG